MISDLVNDLRFVARTLRRNAVFTLSVSATLALGIGALSSVFSAVYAVLLRPLPYRDADRLVTLWVDLRANGRAEPEWLSFPDFADWRDNSRSLSGAAAYTGWSATIPGRRQHGARAHPRRECLVELLRHPRRASRTGEIVP